jgi:hypothetical protein
MIDYTESKLKELTLAELLQGDSPQLPRREVAGLVQWWDIGSSSADRINYKDFRINKGEMIIGQGNRKFTADSNGIYLGNAIYASAPFRVDMSGNLYATNAQVSGVVNATSGTIGGFTITSTRMYGGIIKTGENVGAGQNGVIMDTDGLRGYSETLGEVFNLPTDGSAPTFTSGVINNTVYEIDTNSIMRTSEDVGDGTANSAGILINETGFYATQASQTLANANVRILATGEATFSGSVKGGMTDFMVGEGYFMGLSSGVYKMAVGNPEGNYMSWNNEQLRVKGIIELDGPLNLEGYATANLPVPPSNPGFNLAEAYE